MADGGGLRVLCPLEIARREKPIGAIVQLGGQTPLKLAHGLENNGIRILGTSVDAIDLAEDRGRFGDLIAKLGLRQPDNGTATSEAEALAVAERIGYPVVVRPSYVLGGQAMRIVYTEDALKQYLQVATQATPERPVLVDRYLEDAFEYDVDGLCDGERTMIAGVLEQVEEAGVHSGDSTALLPPLKVKPGMLEEMREVTRKLGQALGVRGLMNVQFAEKDGLLYVLEVNPRASRTVPFLAKALNLPLVQWATRLMIGQTIADLPQQDDPQPKRWYAKAPVFVFKKFPGVDVLLGPEMRSTGEVMGVGDTPGEAYWKSLQGAGIHMPAGGTVFLSVNNHDKPALLPIARRLHELGFSLLGTRGTALHLFDHGMPCQLIYKVGEGTPDIASAIHAGQVQVVVNTPLGQTSYFDDKAIRVAASSRGVPCITTLSAAEAAVDALERARGAGVRRFAVQD